MKFPGTWHMKYHSKNQEHTVLKNPNQYHFHILAHAPLAQATVILQPSKLNLHKQKNWQMLIKSYINNYLNYTEQTVAYSKSIKQLSLVMSSKLPLSSSPSIPSPQKFRSSAVTCLFWALVHLSIISSLRCLQLGQLYSNITSQSSPVTPK